MIAADNVDPILDGLQLFGYRVTIVFDAVDQLRNGNVFMSDPAGKAVPGATGFDVAIAVSGS